MSDAMTYRGHASAIMKLGLPLIGGNLAQFAITLTDTVMLGWYDVEVLAGQVLGHQLRVELRALDLLDVDVDLAAHQLHEIVAQLVDFGTLAPDDDSRSRGEDRDP